MKNVALISLALIVVSTLSTVALFASSDDNYGYRDHASHEKRGYGKHGKYSETVAPVADENYAEECGACHFAYQPGLLPAAAWTQMMNDLADHFGENAELSDEPRQALTAYLTANAADVKPSEVYYELAGRGAVTTLRISELSGFRHEHREIPRRMVEDNPEVQSFSQCARCHTDAEQGRYDEHQVMIPGYGRFED
jgi:hypothetical protein